MAFFSFFHNLHIFGAVLNPFLMIWGGLTLFEVMVLEAWFTFAVFALEVPTGVIADVFGRKNSIVIGAFLFGLGFILYPLMRNVLWFAFAEFVMAVSYSLISGADSALIHDSSRNPTEAKKSQGRYSSFGVFGISVGPFIGSFLYPSLGLTGVMSVTAIPMFFSTLIALSFREPKKDTAEPETQRFWHTLMKGTKYFVRHKELRLLALNMAVVTAFSKTMIWLFQPRLLALGLDVRWLGVILGTAIFIEVLIMNSAHWFEKILGRKSSLIFLTGFLPAIGFLLVATTSSILVSMLGIFITIGIGMSRKPYFVALYNEHISSGQRATVLSSISMLSSFVMMIAGPVAGKLADWSMVGTLGIFGVALALFTIWSNQGIKALEK